MDSVFQCRMQQPHPTPHKNRIIPIFGCGCRIRHWKSLSMLNRPLVLLFPPDFQDCGTPLGPEWALPPHVPSGAQHWSELRSGQDPEYLNSSPVEPETRVRIFFIFTLPGKSCREETTRLWTWLKSIRKSVDLLKSLNCLQIKSGESHLTKLRSGVLSEPKCQGCCLFRSHSDPTLCQWFRPLL
jgi:hypothetical protein